MQTLDILLLTTVLALLPSSTTTAPADALTPPIPDDLSPAIALATRLREGGVRTQLYTEQKKFKQKMAYADKIGVPYIAILGEDEIKEGAASIKDMTSGEQKKLTYEQAVTEIKAGLALRNQGTPVLDK